MSDTPNPSGMSFQELKTLNHRSVRDDELGILRSLDELYSCKPSEQSYEIYADNARLENPITVETSVENIKNYLDQRTKLFSSSTIDSLNLIETPSCLSTPSGPHQSTIIDLDLTYYHDQTKARTVNFIVILARDPDGKVIRHAEKWPQAISPKIKQDQSDVFQMKPQESRKRVASEELTAVESDVEGSTLSPTVEAEATSKEGSVHKAPTEKDSHLNHNQEGVLNNNKKIGKPFRNPMIKRRKTINDHHPRPRQHHNQLQIIKQLESQLIRLSDGQRILRDSMIEKVEKSTEKWVDVGREAAEYLWNLVGKEQSTEPIKPSTQYESKISSWTFPQDSYTNNEPSFGYDRSSKPVSITDDDDHDQQEEDVDDEKQDRSRKISDSWDNDSYHRSSDLRQEEEEEYLPSANELIGGSGTTRHYDVDGLQDQHLSKKSRHDPTLGLQNRLDRIDEYNTSTSSTKQPKDVGWMMTQMGLDASLFGWNSDEGNWIS
ncbi:hypothetical protein PSTG_10043 [Puccinia striiformis f. sp. tritici PST-78]|uniref:Uncharacterized protein n=1 Tax=Puccinia striiformis f. sp. tritici PST-78 TaxID=1165861 RepID=A0A0L0VBQ9_9BASI|nr:hypothetical protein PSTG_10043 [Puccinia striiformis f. sp. tritici PST-78]